MLDKDDQGNFIKQTCGDGSWLGVFPMLESSPHPGWTRRVGQEEWIEEDIHVISKAYRL